MMNYGVKSILDYSAEEDLETKKVTKLSEHGVENEEISKFLGRKYSDPNEVNSDKNAKIFMDCIDAVSGNFLYILKDPNIQVFLKYLLN